MFKLSGSFIKLSLDKAAFSKALYARIEEIQYEGAKAWLRANLERIPVYTGTARGTFIPLSIVIGVGIPINPVAHIPGRGPDYGSTLSDFEFKENGGIFTFSFTQRLPYFLLNEFNAVRNIPSTPWHSSEYAKDAYLQATSELMKTIPNLGNFVVKTVELQHG